MSTPRLASSRAAYSPSRAGSRGGSSAPRPRAPSASAAAQRRVVAQRVADEVGELGERLDARVAGADEDVREVLGAPARSVARGRGASSCCSTWLRRWIASARFLKPSPCSASPGIGSVARDRRRARATSSLVADLERGVVGLDRDRARFGVDRGRAAEQQLGARAHQPERDDDVARLERPGRGLGQDRREEHEVLEADDRRAAPAEQLGDVRAGEAAADDERAAECLRCGMTGF